MDNKYSVLMSVYGREKPQYLKAAIESILNQTWKADEFILVCDGALTEELEAVLSRYHHALTIVRNPINRGLGYSLARGLESCCNEWIVRMDSDDISSGNRCEQQLRYLLEHTQVDVLSGVIAEFKGEAKTVKEAESCISAYKKVPLNHEDLYAYAKYRNPINHPCVLFKKSKALEAGGYQDCPFFEDYDLWVRMLKKGCVFANLDTVLLYMRVNGMHRRRGGFFYARAIFRFEKKMHERGMITLIQYVKITSMRVGISILPDIVRKMIYDIKLRTRRER